MKRRIPIGRLVALAIAGLLIYLTFSLKGSARETNRQFEEWRRAEPIHMMVDLSKEGKYFGSLHHTCRCGHGEFSLLRLSPPLESKRELEGAANGFTGKVWIDAPDGRNVGYRELKARA